LNIIGDETLLHGKESRTNIPNVKVHVLCLGSTGTDCMDSALATG